MLERRSEEREKRNEKVLQMALICIVLNHPENSWSFPTLQNKKRNRILEIEYS